MKTSLLFTTLCLFKAFVVSALINRRSIDAPDPQCYNQPFTIKWKGFKAPFIYQKFKKIEESDRGAWIDPSLVPIVFGHTLQFIDIVFPNPLLPTENTTILGIYREAIEALRDYDSKSDAERAQDLREYYQNRDCWKARLNCRQSSFPFYKDCESDAQGAAMHDFFSEKTIEHDLMTVELLRRSHRMGLVDLGRSLLTLVNKVGDAKKTEDADPFNDAHIFDRISDSSDSSDEDPLMKLSRSLEKQVDYLPPHDGRENIVIKRVRLPEEADPFNDAHIIDGIFDSSDSSDEDPLMKLHRSLEKRVDFLPPHDGRDNMVIERIRLPEQEILPMWILRNPMIRRFFEDPVHWAQYKEVFDPHLPGYPYVPQPLLPATNDDLLALYKRAMHYYQEDQKLSDVYKRLREGRRHVNAQNWLRGHPCYCQFNLCLDVNMAVDSMLAFNWLQGQESERVHMVKQAELLGLIDLGERLAVEINGGAAPF